MTVAGSSDEVSLNDLLAALRVIDPDVSPLEGRAADAIELLLKGVRFMEHDANHCLLSEWTEACDHFRTSFGVPIDGPECECGMIKVALAIERAFFGNRAIPQQHYEELGV